MALAVRRDEPSAVRLLRHVRLHGQGVELGAAASSRSGVRAASVSA